MAKTDTAPAHERPTLGAQLARQHELLMATLTKPARTGSQTMEWGERATGELAGHLYLKSAVFVQHEDESDVQFLGRQMQALRAARLERDTFNLEPADGDDGGEGGHS